MHNQNILKKIRDIHFSFSEFAACCPELLKLKEIPQNAEYHAEGDVYRHTEMVCEKLVELSEWEQLESEEQEILFLSAARKKRMGNGYLQNTRLLEKRNFVRWSIAGQSGLV